MDWWAIQRHMRSISCTLAANAFFLAQFTLYLGEGNTEAEAMKSGNYVLPPK